MAKEEIKKILEKIMTHEEIDKALEKGVTVYENNRKGQSQHMIDNLDKGKNSLESLEEWYTLAVVGEHRVLFGT